MFVYQAVDRDVISIGSSPENDLVVLNPRVSAHHAEIRRDGEDWVLADLASRHGTLLNGQRVTTPAGLVAADEIGLGTAVVLFDAPELDIEPVTPEPVEPAEVSARPLKEVRTPLLVGNSPPMVALRAMIDKVAPSNVTLLINGESGTGKEIVAQLVHHRSARAARPFVVVNCPALPGSLVEYELFGVGKRVATGVDARPGLLEAANGGTLLLDEIGDLESSAQAKLLRFIQDKKVERIGGRKVMELDVRILAATNHDLEAAIEKGTFRMDLYHRLNTVTLHTPPLRDRREDIPALVNHFLSRAGERSMAMSPEALQALMGYHFPGNVRELERIVERARLLADGPKIEPRDLPDLRKAETGASGVEAQSAVEAAGKLYERVVEAGESFWDVVHAPFLHRRLSKDAVHKLIEQCYVEAHGSNRQMARLFHLNDLKQYKRLTAFLRNHDLLIAKRGSHP